MSVFRSTDKCPVVAVNCTNGQDYTNGVSCLVKDISKHRPEIFKAQLSAGKTQTTVLEHERNLK